jgi:DNA-binding MarR family transcriptional regulator
MNQHGLTNHELDAPPWLRVESTLMATARLVREAFDLRLAPLELNLTQASLLGYVVEFGATTQTRLADRLGIGRAAIGSVVDRLQDRGLVERRPDPDDRRVWLVEITERGRELVGRVDEVDRDLRAELRFGIGREERQALAWVMTRLQENLRAAIERPANGAAHPIAESPHAPESPGPDSVRRDSVRPDPVRPDPVGPDPVGSDPVRPDSSRPYQSPQPMETTP